MAAWVYIWAMIVSITAVAQFGSGFFASLFDLALTKEVTLGLTLAPLIVALLLNFSGNKTMARVAQIGLAAGLVGVIGVGPFAFGGYVLAAPDLASIVSGADTDPIPHILESTLGAVGAKIFLVVALTAFLSCVLSLQAAASRLLFSFARDGMIPGHRWLAKVSPHSRVPINALIVACGIPVLICLVIYVGPDGLLTQVTAFAVIGIYVAFQSVVLASLRQRVKGWRPAGPFNLGRAGFVVNVAALVCGIGAMVLLAWPGRSGVFLNDWIVLIGLFVVVGSGLLYLFLARPDRHSTAPQGDAIEIAGVLRGH
jgi:amino acid transporter